VYAKEEMGQKL